MRNEQLSEVQQRILGLIRVQVSVEGRAPSQREITEGAGRAQSTVRYRLTHPTETGYLEREEGRHHALRLR